MKTILYSFITIYIFVISNFCLAQKVNAADTIISVQAINKGVSASELSKAAYILSNRLKNFSSEKFEVTQVPEKGLIKITLSKNWDAEVVEKLVTTKGELAFYEIYSRQEIQGLCKDSFLISFMKPDISDNLGIKLGVFTSSEVTDFNKHLKISGQPSLCLFAWDFSTENNEACLYALKLNNENRALISSTAIESVKSIQEKSSMNYEFEIKFKKEAIETWAKATQTNMNKAIAVVLDGNVIYTPVLKTAIKNGVCSITGRFTKTEAKLFESAVNSGILPVDLKVIK